MASVFGSKVRVSLFGQSHGAMVGAVMDGLPAGEKIDTDALAAAMARRAPGRDLTSPRQERDEVRIVSGVVNGVTCGAPLCLTIENTSARPADYDDIHSLPRPGHADMPAHVKYHGYNDARGGGHFSARLTAPMTAAGAILRQMYLRRGIHIGGHILAVGGVEDSRLDPVTADAAALDALAGMDLPVLCPEKGEEMLRLVSAVREKGDSIGGRVECAVCGLPVGVGEPVFDGLENRIAAAVFAVPAVKGLSFGDGFGASRALGSENNDAYGVRDGRAVPLSNHAGGILGGLSTGLPLILEAAFKPTPSIALPQRTVDMDTLREETLRIAGRHDPCVVLRAVPCVEAAVALALADFIL